jgi:hypothetical protein
MAVVTKNSNDRDGEFAHNLIIQSDLGGCSDLRRGSRVTVSSSDLEDMSDRNLFSVPLRS